MAHHSATRPLCPGAVHPRRHSGSVAVPDSTFYENDRQNVSAPTTGLARRLCPPSATNANPPASSGRAPKIARCGSLPRHGVTPSEKSLLWATGSSLSVVVAKTANSTYSPCSATIVARMRTGACSGQPTATLKPNLYGVNPS